MPQQSTRGSVEYYRGEQGPIKKAIQNGKRQAAVKFVESKLETAARWDGPMVEQVRRGGQPDRRPEGQRPGDPGDAGPVVETTPHGPPPEDRASYRVVEQTPSRKAQRMARDMELCQLDLRYEGCRMKNAGLEERLLGSIAQRGIQEPLEGVEVGEQSVLLNGFKRYRCAHKLQIRRVPYLSLGADEVVGILNLLRTSHNRALSLLEQAAFIDELKNTRHLSVAEIAQELSRSKSWVSMRLGLMGEMSAAVRQQLFDGAFPVYAYMYTVRQFRRIKARTRGSRAEPLPPSATC